MSDTAFETLVGYTVTETPNSIGFVYGNADLSAAPIFHIPRKKILEENELDEMSQSIRCTNAGKLEGVDRAGFPVHLKVDKAFLDKIRAH